MADVGTITVDCPECGEALVIPVLVKAEEQQTVRGVLQLTWDQETVDRHIDWCPGLVEVGVDELLAEIERALGG